MGGSLGSAEGEKVFRLFSHAVAKRFPVIGFCQSGGARMQEGLVALGQMAKVSVGLAYLGTAGLPYISVVCDPCIGGVYASFAQSPDLTFAEPGARMGISGARVSDNVCVTEKERIAKTKVQLAESRLENGAIDAVLPRPCQRPALISALRFFGKDS